MAYSEKDCPNCICKWRGSSIYYEMHKRRCSFQTVKCYCGQTMLKGSIFEHLASECQHRLVDYSSPKEFEYFCNGIGYHILCPLSHLGCSWYGTSAKYKEVHTFQCDYQNVNCWCEEWVQKIFLVRHLEEECKLRLHLQPGVIFLKNEAFYMYSQETEVNKTVKEENRRLKDLLSFYIKSGKGVHYNLESLKEENRRLKDLLSFYINCE